MAPWGKLVSRFWPTVSNKFQADKWKDVINLSIIHGKQQACRFSPVANCFPHHPGIGLSPSFAWFMLSHLGV